MSGNSNGKHNPVDIRSESPLETLGNAVSKAIDPYGVTTSLLAAQTAWLMHPLELSRAASALSGDLLALPDFMRPREAPPPRAKAPVPAAKPAPVTAPVIAATQDATAGPDEALKRKLICVTCGDKITFPEGKFCWANEKRFGGFQYCREHQAQFQ